jgi:hypothetical protein
MNIGIICDVNTNTPVGIIGVDKETGDIGYITKEAELDECIEIILDTNQLDLPIREDVDNNEILRVEKIEPTDDYYLIAFNYHLPEPWRVLGVRYDEGDFEELLNATFEMICSED